ncbi:cobalamin B12-binding domain-containing protein [Pseudomonas sp. GM55]|uniref:cobalamin B12-binding domain-containing protein n=1 Tax=Pseudomonas sp. GM55 TaxID=1144333 RepID=UPI0012FCE1DE|nr:cobalamin-dependent protein [Pseudomonas sp. GM55]
MHHGRPPQVLLGKLGLDGHDRRIRLINSVLVEAGFRVMMLPLFQSPTELLASKDGAGPIELIGFSSLAGMHNEILYDLLEHLCRRRIDVPVVLSGIIAQSGHRLTH